MKLTDFHSHILPAVDDGSESLAQSLEMLRASSRQGVSRMVATPHFYPQQDEPEGFLQRRNQAFDQLQEAMAEESGLPQVLLGAEVYYFPGISESEDMQKLTLGDKGHIMIELPMARWTDSMYRELERLNVRQGLVPVIAHLDRYLQPFTWKKVVAELLDLPVVIQANGEFFLNRATQNRALRMLEAGQIHILGSDCHNLADRSPNLGKAAQLIEAKLGMDALEAVEACANQVI